MKKQKRVIKEDYLPQITLLLLDVCVVRLLFLFNSEFLMASLSFLVLLVLSYLLLLSSAEEEMEHPLKCPPPSHCEKPATFGSPLDNKTDPPECEFCTVMGCTQEIPLIQTEIQGKVFLVKNISESEAQVIQNDLFQMYSQSNMCESFNHSIFSGSSATSFKPGSTVTLLTRLNCGRIFHNGFIIGLIKKNEFWNCQDFVIRPNLPSHGPVPPPPDFSIIQFPVKMSLGISDLLPLLDLPRECHGCNSTGGQCQKGGKGNFWCLDGKRDGNRLKLGLGLAVSASCIGVLLILLFYLWRNFTSIKFMVFWKKQTEEQLKVEAFLRNYGSMTPKRYDYSEIKKITLSFKDKLGKGGYGNVYKGKLLSGTDVAVKVLERIEGNGEEFINEVASISRTSHVNIVSLLGFCFEGSKRALIYEFMPNGSLENFIYNGNPLERDHQLGWKTLYNIAIGIARGLEYLHRGCNARILHFDIKPHNILLTEDFCPKISDFGLAKLCTRKDSIISMLGTRGTPGYIAPELFSRAFGGVSHKSDVYSYGMMVLEMVGGRNDGDDGGSRTSEIYFPDSIYKRLAEEEDMGLQEVMNEEKECIRKMTIVSLWCIQTKPSDRPPMRQVLDMLGGSLQALQFPPKPFLYSPPRALLDSSATTV